MNYLTERKYSFLSDALPHDTFAVVAFTGEEGLSKPYRFDIKLVTQKADIDLDAVMEVMAKLIIHREEGGDISFNGILASFEQQQEVDGYVFYQATLVPRLWWLSLTHHNQVFLDQSVKEIVEAVLKDGGLASLDFEFRLQGEFAPQEYVCQYAESHLDFIQRWLAREGIYYYFEQTDQGERVVFTDTVIAHRASPLGTDLIFAPPSGLNAMHAGESVQGFVCRQHQLPKSVLLKDYNYRKPTLEMTGSAEVDPKGRGERFIYGEHFRTPEEGNRLAHIRAQELLCRKREFIGESTVPYISPGFTFAMQRHYRDSFNRKYLTIEMTHAGTQTGYLISGIQNILSDREQTVSYSNQFTAIPDNVQFRPPITSEPPKITGTLNAKIDAEGTGQYAELDSHGRYKVLLPFDKSGRKDGKGSTWLRMAQPYAGADHGMHFPLHKGTEVLLTFIDGNPDRPIIQSAVPNPETPSVVTAAGQTASRIKTASGHQLIMGDKADKEAMGLYCSHGEGSGSWVWMGKKSPPKFELKSQGDKREVTCGASDEIVLGTENSVVVGSKLDVNIGSVSEVTVAMKFIAELADTMEMKKGAHLEFGDTTERVKDSDELMGVDKVVIKAGLNPVNKLAVSKARTTGLALLAAAGAALSAVGGTIANAAFPYPDEDKESGEKEHHKTEAEKHEEEKNKNETAGKQAAVSLAVAAVGTLAQVAAMKTLMKSVNTAVKDPYSKIKLDDDGIKIHTKVAASKGIRLGIGDNRNSPTSFIKIVPGAGSAEKITIEKDQGGKITVFDKGVTIEKSGGAKIEIASGTGGDADNIVLTKGNGKVVVKDGTIEVTTGGGKLTVAAASVKMEKDGKSVSVDGQGIKMSFGGNEVSLSSAAIEQKGNFIKLG